MALVRLPPNTGPAARRLATIDAVRLTEIQQFIASLWSPTDCPPQFLPHLAWALSVDVWDDAWDEAQKRNVIAAAPIVHRFKGTDMAVETALKAFNLDYDDVEWWETEPIGARGTFAIDVYHSDVPTYLDEDLREQVFLSVKGAKPKSRFFSIRHFITNDAKGFVGALISSSIDATLQAILPEPNLEAATAYTALFIHSEINVELT